MIEGQNKRNIQEIEERHNRPPSEGTRRIKEDVIGADRKKIKIEEKRKKKRMKEEMKNERRSRELNHY